MLSNSLKSIPEKLKDNAELVNGSLRGIVKTLNDRGYNELYIDGGLTIQGFLNEDFIDEMIIATIPVLLGGGTPLFGDLQETQEFDHRGTEILINEIVQSRYTRKQSKRQVPS